MAFVSNINSNGIIATVTSLDVVTSAPLLPTPKPSLIPAVPLAQPTGSPQLSDSTVAYSLTISQQASLGDNDQSFSSTISFAKLASTPIHSLIPTSKPTINALGVEPAANTHTSSRAIATTLIVLLFFFGIIFIAGYWTSDRASRLKGLRWTRSPESKWPGFSSSRVEPKRYISMRQVLEGRTEQPAGFKFGVDQSAVSPGFKPNSEKRNPIQSYLNYRRACATDSLEEINEEGDSINQTTLSKKTSKPSITPGLGPARYRLKTGKWGVGSSRNPFVNSNSKTAPNPHPSSCRQTCCISRMGLPESKKQRGIHGHRTEDLENIGTDIGFSEFGINQRHREAGSNRSTGASYLLTRLKESISGRSKLSSVRSSGCQFQPESPCTKGKGPAEWESEDEIESNTGPEDASELRYLVLTTFNTNTPTKDIPRKRELSLAEIPLPEMPALAWDMTAAAPNEPRLHKTQTTTSDTCRRYYEEMSTPTRPRHSEWMLSSQTFSPSSLSPASPDTPTRKLEKSTPNLTENRTYLASSRLTF
ncbi:hypothetical protein PGT21_015663 [Puccinia graminis f. sp. tritici]|uniref:Uncharacterized protein n=1 Tax=Puccinia graminis f. sp. tritici TaxID=56615 RepID=A0A5B0R0P4_PUCGR|nr:hypothetical protein PGT21_015663 [Puccinia graminis f. sp. tritici]